MRPRFVVCAITLWAILAPIGALAQEPKDRYDQTCARCHKVEVVVGWMKKHPDAAKRQAWLNGKLAKHNAPDAKLRADIIAYLEQVFSKAAK